MYHAMEENRLYDFTNGIQTDVELVSRDKILDPSKFLDGVQEWIEKHPDLIKEKYLPFSFLAVGLAPLQASAFMYGCIVGRALEKDKAKVVVSITTLDKRSLAQKVKKNINQHLNWFKSLRKQMDKLENEENKPDDEGQQPPQGTSNV